MATQSRLRILQNYFTATGGQTTGSVVSTSGPVTAATSNHIATATSGPAATSLTIPAAKTTAATASTYSYGYNAGDPTRLTLLPKAAAAASTLGVIGSVLVVGAAIVGVGLLSYAITKAALEP